MLQSLFLAAIGEARDRGVKAIETFGYRYPEGETSYERVLVHRTVFPADFLADFGFVAGVGRATSASRASSWAGSQPVEDGLTARALRRVKEAFAAPVPQWPSAPVMAASAR